MSICANPSADLNDAKTQALSIYLQEWREQKVHTHCLTTVQYVMT